MTTEAKVIFEHKKELRVHDNETEQRTRAKIIHRYEIRECVCAIFNGVLISNWIYHKFV